MERQRGSSPIPAHLYDVTRPEQSAWEGFFRGASKAAERKDVSLRRFTSYTTFPYHEENELSLLTVLTYGYKDNPLDFIHSQSFHVWRGRRFAATAVATGIFLDDELHLTETLYLPNSPTGFSTGEIYKLLHYVGGMLEQPQEYNIFPTQDQV